MLEKDLFEVEIKVIFSPKYADISQESKNDSILDFNQKGYQISNVLYGGRDRYPEVLEQKFILHYNRKNKGKFEIKDMKSVEPESSSFLGVYSI